jgi:hypothetical protein
MMMRAICAVASRDAAARYDVVARPRFAGPHPNVVLMLRRNRDGTDRRGVRRIEHRLPIDRAVRAFPQAAAGGADVKQRRIQVAAGDGGHATAAGARPDGALCQPVGWGRAGSGRGRRRSLGGTAGFRTHTQPGAQRKNQQDDPRTTRGREREHGLALRAKRQNSWESMPAPPHVLASRKRTTAKRVESVAVYRTRKGVL